MSTPDSSPGPSRGTGAAVAQHLLVHLLRVLRCDFTRMRATDGERAALAGAKKATTHAPAQDLLAWRRSMSLVAALFAASALVFALIDTISSVSDFADMPQITSTATWLVIVTFLSKLALLGGLLVGIRCWHDIQRSRRALLLGWGIAILVPVLVILLPISELMFDWSQVSQQDGQEVTVITRSVMEALLAIAMFWSAVPSVLALFPGMLRAALTVKTLLPTRAVGPLVAAGLAPIYAVFFVVVFGQVLQLSGSAAMSFGILSVAAAPLVYVWRGRTLAQPLSPEDARGWTAAVRNHSRILSALGLLLVFIGLFETRMFGVSLLGWSSDSALFSAISLTDLLLWFVAMLTTYTVVATDGLLMLMHTSAKEWAEAKGRRADDETLGATQGH